MDQIERTIQKIEKAPKYSGLYQATIRRVVVDMATKVSNKKLEKASRKKLHQIWGAYISKINYEKLYLNLQNDLKNIDSDSDSIKKVLIPILQSHSSVNERLPILEEFYSKIFNLIGDKVSIADYGCGLNPLTYSWMSSTASYIGLDIDLDMISFCNKVNTLIKVNESVNSKPFDVFVDDPVVADVSFLFKLLPLLERQEKGSSELFVKKLESKYQVWSFPALSLGGRHKNMQTSYSYFAENLADSVGFEYEKLIFEMELVYVVTRR